MAWKLSDVEQATAAPGEKRDIPAFCKHDLLVRRGLTYVCACEATFDVVEVRR
jgi:hypothetical protein